MNQSNYEFDFRAALSAAGVPISPTSPIIVDDRVHRYKAADDKEADAWYALHLIPTDKGDPIVAGAYGHWARLAPVSWCSRQRNSMSREEAQAVGQASRDIALRRAEDERRVHAEAAEKCRRWFNTFPAAQEGDSMYLMLKGVPKPHGPAAIFAEELYQGWLALPLQDVAGTIRSAQFISDDGTKKFCYGGEVKGCFYPLATVPGGPIIICEGYATGASLYEATGWTVACAMNCGNLLPVAQSFRALFPDRSILIAADNDLYTDGNPGLTKARLAAKAAKAIVAYPDFPESSTSRLTDFNDLAQSSGIAEVKRQLFSAFPVIGRPIGILTAPPDQDPTELLRYRYLCERGGLLFNGPTGVGKCLGKGTPVMMFDGTIKPVESIIIGDALMGPDSLPRTVLSTCSGFDELYTVKQKRRDSYVCNSAHILSLKMTSGINGGGRGLIDGETFDINLQDYLRTSKTFKHCAKGFAVPISWPFRPVPIPAYFLGLWLGDGTASNTSITNPDPEVLQFIHDFGDSIGLRRRTHVKVGCTTLTVTRGRGHANPVLDALRTINVLNNKHIPLLYRANSESVRLDLLAGLIDSDGHLGHGCIEITSKYQRLASDIACLARSLGFRCTITPEFKRCQTGAGAWYHRALISGDLSRVPTKVLRKIAAPRRQKKDPLVSGIQITPAGPGQYFGFTLTGDGRFLLGDFTVTHNSSVSIQQAACWCNGLPFFGIYPAKRLKIVIIQAENDDGDVAQMRDGIATGLNLTPEQRQTFFEMCIVHTATRGITGRNFCLEIVRPLLDLHAPHMLHIDPALSFIGGDVKEQKVVGEFLRAYLNPELFDHRCGCELFHHTNKPLVGREKANWVNGEWAYSGSGSAEFANWARAILALQSLGVPGFYQLHAGKRGGRLGWSAGDDQDVAIYKQPIAWSNQKGLIFWRTPAEDEIPSEPEGPGRPSIKISDADLLGLIARYPLPTTEWRDIAIDELGIKKSKFYERIKQLDNAGKIFLSQSNKRWSVVTPRSEPDSPTASDVA